MKPALLQLRLGDTTLALPGYGLLVLLGFALATALAVRQAARTLPPPDPGRPAPAVPFAGGAVVDLAFWVLVAGVAGSRLLFVLLNAGDFARLCAGAGGPRPFARAVSDCLAPLKLWDGGLVFYGGVAAAALVTAGFVRRYSWRFAVVGDVLAPGLALGHAVGRLGCFLAGCCFGKTCPAGGAPCVAFPAGSVAHSHLAAAGQLGPAGAVAPVTPPLHPTQLYEAAALLGIFALLLLWRRRQRFAGQLFLVYLLAYGLARAALEVFRGDVSRRFLFRVAAPGLAGALGLPPAEPLALSTSQALGLALALLAAVILVRRHPGRVRAGAAARAG
jgi:phosphatidylglycerol:prolipoprotein diacylglycerol transferase